MKRLTAFILSVFLFISAFSISDNAIAEKNIYTTIKYGLTCVPLTDEIMFGQALNDRITIDYFLKSKFDDSQMLKYILQIQAVCSPYIKDKIVDEIRFRHVDVNYIDDFEYTTKGAAFGKIIDKRSGKKITHKFSNVIDVFLYNPLGILETVETASNEQLELVRDFVQYVSDNPKKKSKQLLSGFSKKHDMKSKQMLADLETAMYHVYVGK